MSTLKLGKIENLGGIEQYLCKAWVNFNGTGTVAIRAAGNVSSITDNGTGDYTVNLTTAMSDANYATVTHATYNDNTYQGSTEPYAKVANITTTAIRLFTYWHVQNVGLSAQDINTVTAVVFR